MSAGRSGGDVTIAELGWTLRTALEILGTDPWAWVKVFVVYVFIMEVMCIVPVVGFTMRAVIGGLVGGQLMGIMHVSTMGITPSPIAFQDTFVLPPGSSSLLAIGGAIPFVVSVLYLLWRGGWRPTLFFFTLPGLITVPSCKQMREYRIVQHLASLPLCLLAGAVILKGVRGAHAFNITLTGAAYGVVALLMLGALGVAVEYLMFALPRWMPKPAAIALAVVIWIAYVSFAWIWNCTLSEAIFLGIGPDGFHAAPV
jgi:hypothetical protein